MCLRGLLVERVQEHRLRSQKQAFIKEFTQRFGLEAGLNSVRVKGLDLEH